MHTYDRVSRYKASMMGIAILIVVLGHLFYYHSGLKDYSELNIFMWYSIGSVDMFLFLSGFGISRSLSKNSDPVRFMGRRLSRLMPSYLPFIVIFCGFMLWAGRMNKWQALGNLTTFGWWTQMGGQFNWYIPTQIALYLLSPLFYGLIQRYGKRSLWVFPLLFLLDAACVGTGLMISVSRFPVYFLGMYLGNEALLGRQPSRRHLILSGVLMVVSMAGLFYLVIAHPGSLSRYGFWWHPYLLSTPGCLYLISWLMEKQERWAPTRLLNQGLAKLGGHSFEIYLWHILVYTMALHFGVQGWGKWVLLGLCGIVLGMVYGRLLDSFTAWRNHRA